MTYRTTRAAVAISSLMYGAVGCGGGSDSTSAGSEAFTGGCAGIGGNGAGGNVTTGGAAATSTSATGGATASGGTNVGGTSSIGGSVAFGGAESGGKSTGGVATGGLTTTGGSAFGGQPQGGATTGGAIPAGGAVAGGSSSVGSTSATGGALAGGVTSATGGAMTGGVTSAGGAQWTGGAPSGGGVVSTGGAAATGGLATMGGSTGATPTSLPTAKQTCPTLATGMVSFLGSSVSLSVGPANTKGPLLFYWHATGMTYTEVQSGFSAVISEVKSNGGVVASFTTTTSTGTNTGNGVWYTGDIDVADEVLACAIQQGLVDTSRIHVSGYSAGGLQCAAMSYLRSGYVASVLCMSGGFVSGMSNYAPQDPKRVPPAIAAHGAAGSDVFILDFATCSGTYCSSVVSKGGLAINCNDGGDHITSMTTRAATMGPVGWKFFAENPYGADNHYPSGLPSYFPSYCTIAK